jgi:hypothetical protein
MTRELKTCSSGGDGPSRGFAMRRRGLAIGAAMLLAPALPAAAQAAGAPKANTGGAREVGYATATLGGSVNANGNNTSYYFQYGPTKAYGSQSAIADAGSSSSGVSVRLPIGGLQPITVYHYRLVAVNSAGVATGQDNVFKTTKIPLSLQIIAAPNPVPFGGAVSVQGTLSGTGNANRAVVLNATGGFSFIVPSVEQITKYRVFTPTSAPVLSPVATENVAVRVSSHVASTRRRGFARIYGTVTPAVLGAQVGVLRIAQGRGILAGGTIVKPRNSISGQFSRVVRVSKGAYRVLVKVAPGGVVSAYGTPLLIR